MNLVTFAEPVTINFKKSAGIANLQFEAGREYVMPLAQFNRIMGEQAVAQRAWKVSRIETRITNFNVNARKQGTQRLLLYNGSGGYGDQIMTWPFAKILCSMGFEIHILTDPGNQTCWFNFPWIKSIQQLPMQYEHFKMYDYHLVFEAVVNTDEHPFQEHPLDAMCRKVGIDPNSVDPNLKIVRPNYTYLEMQSMAPYQGKKIAMYQLASANQIRCLPPNDSAFILFKLAEAYPDVHWLALFDEFIPETYKAACTCQKCKGTGKIEVIKEEPAAEGEPPNPPTPHNEICMKCQGSGTLRSNIQLYNAPELRQLWALATRAGVIVSPDSMMVHVAGSMDVPCVGLWGLTNPENRVKYYKNHLPIYKRELCPFSPCYHYGGTFPKYCPTRPNRNVCECLGGVAAPDVLEAVKQFMPLTPPAPAPIVK